MTNLEKATDNKNRFPIVGYLFLVGTALFTALSYAFGKAVDTNLDPESTMFFWFFGAFICSIFVVIAIPSQRAEVRKLRNYIKIFLYTSILTSIGAALWIISIRTIGIPLTSFLMKAQTLFALMLGMMFLGERLNISRLNTISTIAIRSMPDPTPNFPFFCFLNFILKYLLYPLYL